jgi:hypothetical protein
MTSDPAAVLAFTGIPTISGGGAVIESAVITSKANAATKLDADLLLFSATISDLDADNAAFTPTDAQLETLVGVISFPTASWKAGDATADAGGNAFCAVNNLGLVVKSDALYGVLVARNAYVPYSGEVFKITLGIVEDYSRNGS